MRQHSLRRLRLLPLSIFLAATVFFVHLGFETEPRGGAWFALAGFCLALGLTVGLFSPDLERALRIEVRRLEYREILDRLVHTLEQFDLPTLSSHQRGEVASAPPGDGDELVGRACREVAARLGGDADPMILELLYRGLHELTAKPLWGRTSVVQRRELATLLAAGGRETGFEPRQLTQALEWILARSEELRLDAVENELDCLERLWRHLLRYAKSFRGRQRPLQSEALLAELLELLDVELDGAMLGQQDLGELAGNVLVEISRPWLRAAAGGESVRSMEVDSLALVTLGIFTAESVPGDLPVVDHLAPQVARQPMALRMLFGHLWNQGLGGEEARTKNDPGRMATAWDEWATAAEAEIGGSVSEAVHGELRALLLHLVWPTWLPMAAAIRQLAGQNERIRRRLEELSPPAVAGHGEHVAPAEVARSLR